jgi:hypothetical protein
MGQSAHRRADRIGDPALAEALREVLVVRRNSRGGNAAVENFVTAVRCLYRHAVADGPINASDNPAANIDKPRRPASLRITVSDAKTRRDQPGRRDHR